MLSEPKISYKPFWGICRPLNSWRANSPNPIQIYCAAITGSIAEAAYGISEDMKEMALSYLDEPFKDVLRRWKKYMRGDEE